MAGLLHSKSCRLACMLSLTASFCLLELVSGYTTNSMALVADAFHMLSDVLALLIAFFSVRIAKRKTTKNTFGWARAEVLGAMINSIFLCALCCSILVEAIKRLLSVEDINDPKQILIVGGCGLIVNIIGMLLFHGQASSDHHYHPPARIGEEQNLEQLAVDEGLRESTTEFMPPPVPTDIGGNVCRTCIEEADDEVPDDQSAGIKSKLDTADINKDASTPETACNQRPKSRHSHGHSHHSLHSHHHHGGSSAGQLNMRAAFLHVMGDALGSVVVIISALIIWLTEWPYRFYIDPVMSGILVAIIICTTLPVLKESALILLQTAPKTLIHIDDMKQMLLREFQSQILSVHELHVWQLAGDKIIASAHLQFRSLQDYMRIAKRLKRFFHEQGIHSITMQPEILAASSSSVSNIKND